MFNILKKAYYNIKIKKYNQDYFDDISGKTVVAYIEGHGWIYGRLKFEIELSNYEYMPCSFEGTTYTRRVDRYSILDIETDNIIYSKYISSMIWTTKSTKQSPRPFGLEPKFDNGFMIEPDDRVYYVSVPEIQYLVPVKDKSVYLFLKTEDIKPS